MIVCRSDVPVADDIRDKVALFCDVDREAVITATDRRDDLRGAAVLREAGLDDLLIDRLEFGWKAQPADLDAWRGLVQLIKRTKPVIEIALVGKYVELPDAYLSVSEALRHAGWANGRTVRIRWVDSEDLTPETVGSALARSHPESSSPAVSGIVGSRARCSPSSMPGRAAGPFLGLCLGLQCAVIEFARHVLGATDANSTEFDPFTQHPVIDFMPDQRDMAGERRHDAARPVSCPAVSGSKAAAAYGEEIIFERHRHRFEVNNAYRDRLVEAGMLMSGQSPDGRLVEIIELRDHPWFVATQFHPEFKSRPDRPHPLFRAFVAACVAAEAAPGGEQGAAAEQIGVMGGRGGERVPSPAEVLAIDPPRSTRSRSIRRRRADAVRATDVPDRTRLIRVHHVQGIALTKGAPGS